MKIKSYLFRLNSYIKNTWKWHILFLLSIPAYIYSVNINLWGLYGPLPSLKALENPKDDLSSELYSCDGVLLGKYFRYNRSPVGYDEISKNIISALLATEDYRFESHYGIDIKGILRAFLLSIVLGKNKGGGSTLTQQLAKNLFKLRHIEYNGVLNNVPLIRMLITKTKEWIVAIQLEKAYTKGEIITLYLNTAAFGSNAYGIKVATRTFFNTTPGNLSISQAASLIGLLKAPSYYSPLKHMDRATARRNVVLGQMLKYNFISKSEYDRVVAEPIILDFKLEDHNNGYATYFRSAIRTFLLRWSKKNGYDLFEDGLKIYTTIDSRLQKHAEDALCTHMKSLQKEFDQHWGNNDPWRDENGTEIKNFLKKYAKHTDIYRTLQLEYSNDVDAIDRIMNTPVPVKLFTWDGEVDAVMSPMEELRYNKRFLHAGFMAMDPNNGEIKAWVGGINHKHFTFDHVIQGTRQCGSTFKPIVYAAAIDNGYMPWHKVVDAPVTFKINSNPPTWTPQNWDKKYSGTEMTLRQALGKSVNSVTAYLTKQLGPETIVDYAKRLGITTHIDPVPAICLGSADVSIYELVGAYSTFMNKGVWIQPHFILRIEDKNGKVLEEFSPQKREAINENTAYLMVHLLRGTTEEHGSTSAGIRRDLREGNEIAGKTGTTQNQSDGWFIGMTQNLCVGVWVGGDHRCIHFRNIALGSGAHMARPIWENFMLAVYNDSDLNYTKGPLINYPMPKKLEQYAHLINAGAHNDSTMDDDCDKYKKPNIKDIS